MSLLLLCSPTTLSCSSPESLRITHPQLLCNPSRTNLQARLVQSETHVRLHFLSFFALAIFTRLHNLIAHNLQNFLLSRPHSLLLHPFLALLRLFSLEPNVATPVAPSSLPLPPLDLSQKYPPQMTDQRRYEGSPGLDWAVEGRRMGDMGLRAESRVDVARIVSFSAFCQDLLEAELMWCMMARRSLFPGLPSCPVLM